MRELFVPYELAVKLKELGFDEPCFGFYDTQRDEFWVMEQYPYLYDKSRKPLAFRQVLEDDFTAPLYQQVTDWLRNVYDVGVGVWYQHDREYCYDVTGFKHGVFYDISGEENDYYKALAKGIDGALNLIQDGKIKRSV